MKSRYPEKGGGEDNVKYGVRKNEKVIAACNIESAFCALLNIISLRLASCPAVFVLAISKETGKKE